MLLERDTCAANKTNKNETETQQTSDLEVADAAAYN